ncbi:hypothetical protein WJ0W_006197 [Paenibacillus melissococcoides]|uniref:Uncharacterized protein n=1 Tax=Paenibacillus melissococcoides TaxID=2912268 RepID=A0ABN8U6U9_9BACL|nr:MULTISPECIES: hypothetical protein [Paenibacillus]CAH8245124.1 hypothetical protein WJ0W_002354 [Paenibacillus melissococcoides]CAH8249010.1 hypothetical protein WJ0W_006197 [Paenibacillus melissococcoides]CAH8709982.1 hypothetical protein WDD9_002436 [Paenibacillus melissococcoides]CAH8710703.1 hypothetical protein HTL2_002721 [Paenibacillus melissococcoides]CAH8716007.1 hypothetical protein HTL2_004473 [Paenibacillus melissococcoides]
MKFTINVARAIIETHRLKKDGKFGPIPKPYKILEEDDMTFNSKLEAEEYIHRKEEWVVDDGITVKVGGAKGLTDPSIHIRAHRVTKPKNMLFTKDELRDILKSGDDSKNNVLIIDWDGTVKLIPFRSVAELRDGYAVRLESYLAGNSYVGAKSRLNHLSSTYSTLLAGWLSHLESHDEVYRDYPPVESDEELISKIKEVYENMVF